MGYNATLKPANELCAWMLAVKRCLLIVKSLPMRPEPNQRAFNALVLEQESEVIVQTRFDGRRSEVGPLAQKIFLGVKLLGHGTEDAMYGGTLLIKSSAKIDKSLAGCLPPSF